MKPLKLYIEGIKSFTDGQEIDFEKLCENRLFGIFGNTGSGKSTILSSIIIALYGEEEKGLNQRDFINMTMSQAKIVFEFAIKHIGEMSVYVIERTFKIRPSGTTDNKAKLFKKINAELLVLEDNINLVNKAIEEIIGLKISEFKKCVVLPQGEFSSFLQATRAERVNIIGKLFDLEQYGDILLNKISLKKAELESHIKGIEGSLSALGDYGDEDAEKLKADISQGKASLKEKQALKIQLAEKLTKQKEDIYAKQKLDNCQNQKKMLELQTQTIDNKKQKSQLHEKAINVLPYIAIYEETLKNHNQAKISLKDKEQELALLSEKFDVRAKEKEDACNTYNTQGVKLKEQKAALEALRPQAATLNLKQTERQSLTDNYKVLDKKKDNQEAELEKIIKQIKDIAQKISEKESILEKDDQNIEQQREHIYTQGALSEAERAVTYLAERQSGHLNYFRDRQAYLANKIAQKKSVENTQLPSEYRKSLVQEIRALKESEKMLNEKHLQASNSFIGTQSELSKVKERGSALKMEIEEIKQSFLSYGVDVKNLDELNLFISQISGNHDKLFKSAEAKTKIYDEQKTQITGLTAEIKNQAASVLEGNDVLQKQKLQYENALRENGFESTESVKQAILDSNFYEKYKTDVTAFSNSLTILNNDIDKLKAELNGKTVDQELFNKDTQLFNQLNDEIVETEKAIAVMEKDLIVLTEKITQIKQLKKDQENLNDELNQVLILHKLISGKKFMEYVAEEIIQGITYSATKHINHLSGGRYVLNYDKDGFCVSDNYSGGQIRKVSTLSGGETFLVSLSLAVSLSEEIVKKSDKMIEFFFLDEGFGTLDKELCETVMEALERLRQSHFTIGLISHVPELMQRLSYKLNVSSPQENKGSTVKHVYM